MKFFALLLGLCCFHQASGAIHSLKYFHTGTTGISVFPEFVSVGFIDDVPFSYYDSMSKTQVPLQKWMGENFNQQYWEMESNIGRGYEQKFKINIEIARARFNQIGGIHVFQRMYGCEWDDTTGATDGFEMYGYDGEDFIVLDLKHMIYIAPVREAMMTKAKWDTDRAQLEYHKHYFTMECVEWLQKYLLYGKSTLGRKVPPEVSLFQRESSYVTCHATGFYPEGVMITWKRDGAEMPDDVDVGETLPNADGTFQKRAILTVPLEERRKNEYTCEVIHRGGEPIVKILSEDEIKRSVPDSIPLGPIIGVVVGLLVLIAVIAGFVVQRNKRKAGFVRAFNDESSMSSNEKA